MHACPCHCICMYSWLCSLDNLCKKIDVLKMNLPILLVSYILFWLSLHSDGVYIFFYQGASATADVHEDIVLRFAHDDLYDSQFSNFGNRFYVFNAADRYSEVPFEYRFETNTPFPYHAELHINRTRFDYEGEYFIAYDYYSLRPHFIIDVNGKF